MSQKRELWWIWPLIFWACCLLHTCPSLTPIHWCCTHKGAALWHFTPKPRKTGSAEDLLLLKYQPRNAENGPCSWVFYKRWREKDKGLCRPALLNSRGCSEIHQHQLRLCGSEVEHEPQHSICFSFLLRDGTGNVSQWERKHIQTCYVQHGEICHQLLP